MSSHSSYRQEAPWDGGPVATQYRERWLAMNDDQRGANGPELIASLRALLAALEAIDRPPTKDDTGKIRKALQMLDALVATAGALRGGELPAESFTRLTTARRSLNQVFVAPKYLRASEATLRQVLGSWELHWPSEATPAEGT